jgi:formate hydrogenlyase subunit 3/multisubunit Na+/H+ antiporter MnhD subunit
MLKLTIEIIGWLAAILMLSAYLLLTAGKLSPRSRVYQWLNVLAGAGFIINSGSNGAYPSAFINVVWILIALYGIFGRSMTPRASLDEA